MKTRSMTVAIAFSALFCGSAFAACDAPEDPSIPSGDAASGADMLKAKKAVEGYVSAVEEYMGCGIPLTQQERASLRMTRVVEKFNEELRAYKAKS